MSVVIPYFTLSASRTLSAGTEPGFEGLWGFRVCWASRSRPWQSWGSRVGNETSLHPTSVRFPRFFLYCSLARASCRSGVPQVGTHHIVKDKSMELDLLPLHGISDICKGPMWHILPVSQINIYLV